jgi:hypothetical protein
MKLRLILATAAIAVAAAPFALAEPKSGEKLDHYILQQSGPLSAGPGRAPGASTVIVNEKIYPLTEGRPLSGQARRQLERQGRVTVEEARGETPVSYSRECVTSRAVGADCSCLSAPYEYGTAVVNPAGGRNICAVP